VAQRTFDILGGVLYIIWWVYLLTMVVEPANNIASCLLELGIFASHLIFLVRSRKIRKDASKQGKNFDEVMTEHQSQGLPFKFAERRPRKASDKKADVEAGNVEWSAARAAARTETQKREPPLLVGEKDQLAAASS
jgi:hypothetical protein